MTLIHILMFVSCNVLFISYAVGGLRSLLTATGNDVSYSSESFKSCDRLE